LIDNYTTIRETLRALNNVKNAKSGLEQLLSLEDTISDIVDMLEDSDDAQLIEAYEKISELEDIRDTALNQIQSGMNYDIPMGVFDKYFKKIDDIGDKFNAVMWNCIENVIEVCGMQTIL
jgi:hypothetical protein